LNGSGSGRTGARAPEDLRVAVVGAGWMGEAHLRAYAAQPGVRIVGLVTHTPARAVELSERYPIEASFDDVETMIDAVAPDGISVTTGEHDHVGPACAALERGIGVLVEKPMASSVEDAEQIAETASRTGAILVPAHVLRFTLPYQALAREIAGGRLGSVVAISSRRDRTRAVAEGYDHIHPAMVTSVHDIDLVLWLTESRVTRVRALESRRAGATQPDLIWAQLELENGVIASVSAANLHPADGSIATSDRLEVYGTDGVASVDLASPLLTFHTKPPVLPDWLWEPPDGGGAFGSEVGHFCACLREGHGSDVVAPEDAVAGIRVAEAMVRSAASDGAVIEL
jgi:predicted dehydrogenase